MIPPSVSLQLDRQDFLVSKLINLERDDFDPLAAATTAGSRRPGDGDGDGGGDGDGDGAQDDTETDAVKGEEGVDAQLTKVHIHV